MAIQMHNQMHPFYETMMLLALSEDLEKTRSDIVEALNAIGLDGDAINREHMSIFEKYVISFHKHKQHEPENAFWMEAEGDTLTSLLLTLLWTLKERTIEKISAKEIFTALADIFAETEYKIDYQVMSSGRTGMLMSAIDQTDMSSKDKWVILQILLNPEDSVHQMMQWIMQNIDAYHKAFEEVAFEYQTLYDRYISYINKENNHFQTIISGLDAVSAIYPSLASPLSQIVIDETAFCGMLTYLLDYSGEEKLTEFLRVGLKALADKSKMEILRLLKAKPMYNQEIAQTLGLTAATVSYHMNALLACQFVTISKADGRVYYHLKMDMLTVLLDQTRALLID